MGEQLRLRRQQAATPTTMPLPSAAQRGDAGQNAPPDSQVPGNGVPESASLLTQVPVAQGPGLDHDFAQTSVFRPRAKLAIGQPGDPAEQEADRVAEQVMQAGVVSAPVTIATRTQPAGPERPVQREGDSAGLVSDVPPLIDEVVQAEGQPLSEHTRAFTEPRFGHDFGDVRVHTDARAAESARAIDALAYTVGRDIVFGADRYAPETEAGGYLLAHELTHVAQQAAQPNASGPARMIQRAKEVIPKVGWGSVPFEALDDSFMAFNPSAEVLIGPARIALPSFPNAPRGERLEEVLVPALSNEGQVSITVEMSWFRDNMIQNDEGSGYAKGSASFKVLPNGTLEWRAPTPEASSNGIGASVVTPVITASGDTLVLTATLNGVGSVSTTRGASASTPSPDGATVGVQVGSAVTLPAGVAEIRPYSVRLKIALPDATTSGKLVDISSTDARFMPGTDEAAGGTDVQLRQWYGALPEEERKSIESGATEIMIDGQAGTLKSDGDNRVLSRQRADKTEQVLRDIVGSGAKFRKRALGESQAFPDDPLGEQQTLPANGVEFPEKQIARVTAIFSRSVPAAPTGTPLPPKP